MGQGKFLHLLEKHDLGRLLFQEVHRHLEIQGQKVSTGTIVAASIIHASSSIRNAEQKRARICTKPEKRSSGVSG